MPLTEVEVLRFRKDFPILAACGHGQPLVYLDNAATSQKPQCVLDAMMGYYASRNANVHRGVHALGELATESYESARKTVQRFLGARQDAEIIFTHGATESINLVAQTFGRRQVNAGDEILVSIMEHHSNFVPWQRLCEENDARLRIIPMNDAGELDLDAFESLLTSRTKLVAITHVSNVLGTVNPIKRIVDAAHAQNAAVLVDGAQSVPHLPVNVTDLGCDFLVFSGHKLFGPTGIGVLYGRRELLDAMPPWKCGGGMIQSVSVDRTTYAEPPARFEAGTPHIAGAIGLAAAIDYVERIGLDRMGAYERELLKYGTDVLTNIDGLQLFGQAREKTGILAFTIEGVHAHDVAQVVNEEGVAIRAGHHCAQPLMTRLGVPATARASVALYNTRADFDTLARAIARVKEVFA